MDTIRVLKLGTVCTEKATGLEGTLTHWVCDLGKKIDYLFQPKGLDAEQQPLPKLGVCAERLHHTEDAWEDVQIPFEILGSTVKDKASGFTGMAVEFVRHINGCFHVTIQPQGTLPGKSVPIRYKDFDLRNCEGEKIPKLTPEERQNSQQTTPSPEGGSFDRTRA